jgi:flagellar biosynthesis/type III secretory pathway protein FliH
VLQTARREGLQEGLQKGLQEGLQEGLQKGLQEGLQKGEMASQLAIAQKLRNTGMAVDTIVEMTGVARDVVESLESNFANC